MWYAGGMKEQELREAYLAGLSKHNHGANEENCSFHHFTTKAKMKAWERGEKGLPFNLKEIAISALSPRPIDEI